MTVIVSGRLQQGLGSLSEPSRIALAFVDGGIEWLAWAVASPSARYEFPDETHLLDGVQRGLHASPLTLLPTLQLLVSPVKLLTLSLADLRALAIVEAGDDSDFAVSRSRAVLDAHHLLPREELATGTGWLAQLGVETAPLFQALDLDGSLALAALGQLPELAGHAEYLQREAAAFGIEMARTPQEFCDYFRLYLDRVDGLGNHAATNAAQRRDAARSAVQALLPLLFDSQRLIVVLNGPARRLADLAHGYQAHRAIAALIRVGSPDTALRARIWRRHLPDFPFRIDEAALAQLVNQYPFNETQIVMALKDAASRKLIDGDDSEPGDGTQRASAASSPAPSQSRPAVVSVVSVVSAPPTSPAAS
ncbi:hypothetical protein, partial [Burkholderia sp. Cy-647]|uniref:hypothetical protein n=1 Tax=Burkholderia sp. Cy-647 TaxID=2608328 RepID=UPI0019659B75